MICPSRHTPKSAVRVLRHRYIAERQRGLGDREATKRIADRDGIDLKKVYFFTADLAFQQYS